MSQDEMRDFCQSLANFNLRVQVRLKNGRDAMSGKIISISSDRFQLETNEAETMLVRFAWVANLSRAAS